MSTKKERLEIRCSARLKAALERVAEAQDMTLSEVIRAALEDYVAPHQAFRVPLVGTISREGIEWNSPEVER
jgi:antitoxin component of RelBE/YafQ-DinJ toxin-antitoxin module